MADVPDHYRLLQVVPEADPEVIQAAYRRLAQKFHPDVASDPTAAARMVEINAAWEVLGDPASRARYDRERDRAARFAAATSASATPDVGIRPEPPTTNRAANAPRPPDEVSRNSTSGRSEHGGGYDPQTMGRQDGFAAAGPPPGDPSGSVLNFGRYAGWSLGELARKDLEYLEWLDRMPIGRPYRDEIDALLRRTGRRRTADAEAADRRGLFRRR